jgi:uncharacterized ferredoxin-like protein
MPDSTYVCPFCGAKDSTTCEFRISDLGTVVPSQQDKALTVGCRVMYFTDHKRP